MSASAISVKRHNHRIYRCDTERKQELLKHLVEQYKDKSVLIISDANSTTTDLEDKNLTLSDDDGLSQMPQRKWDVLISFDLPSDPEVYITRASHAKIMALVIADEQDQLSLYPIETLLGKTISSEIIPGFEPTVVEQPRRVYAYKKPVDPDAVEEEPKAKEKNAYDKGSKPPYEKAEKRMWNKEFKGQKIIAEEKQAKEKAFASKKPFKKPAPSKPKGAKSITVRSLKPEVPEEPKVEEPKKPWQLDD